MEKVLQKTIKVGWIGTGVMGNSMCKHLMKHGYQLHIFTRTKSKAEDLIQSGAKFMDAISLAKEVDYLFLMLGYPHDVEKVVLDPEIGILPHMKEGSFLIDHTTSSPDLAVKIYQEGLKRKIRSLDAPVSGGDIGARNGQLVTMVGADKKDFDEALEILNCYSVNVQLMGGPGAGQHTKMANQIMIANNMIGVCEALVYGHKAGLNLDQMIQLLSKGAAGSFSLEKLGPRMLKRDFDPGFYVEHFVKDLNIALEEARRMNLGLPGLGLATQFYHALIAQGGAKMGTQGLLTTLEKFNAMEVKKYDL